MYLVAVPSVVQFNNSAIFPHYQSKGTADENIADLDISTKMNDADFATAIDVKNENFISSEIGSHFPTHQIIGEESTGTGTVPPLTQEKTWIIDPIGEQTLARGESPSMQYQKWC